MDSHHIHMIFGLLISGAILGLVVSILRLITGAASFVFRRGRGNGNRNSRPNRTDRIIRNRPGNQPRNIPHETNERDTERSQYPNYFE